MKRSLSVLVGGTLIFWLIAAYSAAILWGNSAWLFSSVAGALCLVPATITLFWTQRAFRGLPEQQLLAAFGGMGVRFLVVIAGGMALFFAVPELHYQRLWLWIVAFYLVTLALETAMVVRQPAMADRSGSR